MGRSIDTLINSANLTTLFQDSNVNKQTFFKQIQNSFGHRLNNDYCYCNVIKDGVVYEIFSYGNSKTISVKF